MTHICKNFCQLSTVRKNKHVAFIQLYCRTYMCIFFSLVSWEIQTNTEYGSEIRPLVVCWCIWDMIQCENSCLSPLEPQWSLFWCVCIQQQSWRESFQCRHSPATQHTNFTLLPVRKISRRIRCSQNIQCNWFVSATWVECQWKRPHSPF